MKNAIIISFLLVSLGCFSPKDDSKKLPDEFFTIDVEIVNPEFADFDDTRINIISYQAEYLSPLDIEHYALKKNDANDLFISYYKERYQYSILIRMFGDHFKAFYDKINASANDDIVESISNNDIESSLSEQQFKEIYPIGYRRFQTKKYKKIAIDFRKEIRNLEFFNDISFEE